jgi:Guanosine polyphosphate pyrophosphohydrolases/synthetases
MNDEMTHDEMQPSFVPSSRLGDAVALAIQLHGNQTRKGTRIPYLSHLLGVASLAMEYGADEDQTIAAVLHDAIEDVGAHVEPLIRDRFGDRVTTLVLGCTDSVPDALGEKGDWQTRKSAYLAHPCRDCGRRAAGIRLRQVAQRAGNPERPARLWPGGVLALHGRTGRHALVLRAAFGRLSGSDAGSPGERAGPHRGRDPASGRLMSIGINVPVIVRGTVVASSKHNNVTKQCHK